VTDVELIAIRDGFDARVDQAIHTAQGHPLVGCEIRPPLADGHGQNVRGYSWSIVVGEKK